MIGDEIANVEIEKTKPKPKPKSNISSLKEQLRRLEIVYMAGNKSDEEYLNEQRELKEAIRKAEDETPYNHVNRDITHLKELLETDIESIYKTLDDEDKRRFWRTLINKIHIDGNKISHVDFN